MFEYNEKSVATVVLRFRHQAEPERAQENLVGSAPERLEFGTACKGCLEFAPPPSFRVRRRGGKEKHSKCFVSGKISPYTFYVILVSRQPFDGFVRLNVGH